ncbi:MAG: sigma-70 family RNA polymerase sigma factor [Clostridia bacterium]|nr:sigma-70 family RNA polymerase sigma factor [Clostridia bacterium]
MNKTDPVKSNQISSFSFDEQDFANTVKEFSPYIHSVVSSFPERHREDLYQEGLVALNAACRTFDANKNVPYEAYLKICVKRRIIAAYRVMKKNDETADIDLNEISDPVNIEAEIVEREYTEDFFQNLLEKLTDLEKNVLSEYLADKTYAQISEKLGISEKTVDNTLVRIKNKIKKLFGDE